MDLSYIAELLNDTGLIGEDFYKEHPEIVVPFTLIIIVSAIVGTFGNSLLITALFTTKELRTNGNCFLLNLAFADFAVAAFVGPMTILGIYKGEMFFHLKHELCTFTASLCLTSCMSSLNNIAFVSFTRFVHISRPSLFARLFTRITTPILCFFIWILSFLLHSPILVNPNGTVYDRKNLFCIWNRVHNRPYTIFLSLVTIGLPMILTALCYYKIYSFYRVHVRKTTHEGLNCFTQSQKRAYFLARTLFFIFFTFVLCWLPYVFVILFDEFDDLSPQVHIAVTSIAHINSSLNCIIYGISNSSFRRAYIHILKCTQHKADRKRNRVGQAAVLNRKVR